MWERVEGKGGGEERSKLIFININNKNRRTDCLGRGWGSVGWGGVEYGEPNAWKTNPQVRVISRLGVLEDVLATVLPVTMISGSRDTVCHMDD